MTQAERQAAALRDLVARRAKAKALQGPPTSGFGD
jgi:hypothetical protein